MRCSARLPIPALEGTAVSVAISLSLSLSNGRPSKRHLLDVHLLLVQGAPAGSRRAHGRERTVPAGVPRPWRQSAVLRRAVPLGGPWLPVWHASLVGLRACGSRPGPRVRPSGQPLGEADLGCNARGRRGGSARGTARGAVPGAAAPAPRVAERASGGASRGLRPGPRRRANLRGFPH